MEATLSDLHKLNELAAFNRWAGFKVVSAAPGEAVLHMPWRDDLGQYSGHLHAGVIAALIDTSCGFASATLAGAGVVATQCVVTFIGAGRGTSFEASAKTIRKGRRQIFTTAELHGVEKDGTRNLVATGQTLLVATS